MRNNFISKLTLEANKRDNIIFMVGDLGYGAIEPFVEKHPNKWMPLYSMVTFSHTPYSDALALGKKQEAIMDSVMSMPNIGDIWDSEEIENKILSQI